MSQSHVFHRTLHVPATIISTTVVAENIPPVMSSSRPTSVVFAGSTASSADLEQAQRARGISPTYLRPSRQSSHVASEHRSRPASHLSGPANTLPPDVNALLHKFTDNLHDTLRYERARADLELRREAQHAAEARERADFERDREQAHAADKIKILEHQNAQQQNLFYRILAVEKQRVVDANEREHRAVEAERFRASEQLHFQEELYNVSLQLADKDREIAQLRAGDRTVVSGAHSLIGDFSSPYTTATMSMPLYSSLGAASSALPSAQLSQTDISQLAVCDVTDVLTLPPPLPADQRYPAPAPSASSVPAATLTLFQIIYIIRLPWHVQSQLS